LKVSLLFEILKDFPVVVILSFLAALKNKEREGKLK